ncbi:MAG: hypothetical protein IPJ50_15415 [Betaproteobacteria bacterium]|nr:hypothetical protein [Betaproteobacteria bacterium]
MPFIPLDTPRKATDTAFPRVSQDEQAARDADAEHLIRDEFNLAMPDDSRAALETDYRQRFGKEPPSIRRGFIPLANAEEAQAVSRGFTPLAAVEPAHPSILKTVVLNNPLTAIGETAMNLASQGVAMPVAGLAGIGAGIGNALGLTDKTGADVVHSVGEALTYQPRGELGKRPPR